MRVITSACDASISVKGNPMGNHQTTAGMRTLQRRAGSVCEHGGYTQEQGIIAAYEEKTKVLKVAIRTAEKKCWEAFCEEVDLDS